MTCQVYADAPHGKGLTVAARRVLGIEEKGHGARSLAPRLDDVAIVGRRGRFAIDQGRALASALMRFGTHLAPELAREVEADCRVRRSAAGIGM